MPVFFVCAGLLGLLVVVLTVNVGLMRGRKKINLGDGGDPEMTAAIRAHANLIEFAPLCLLLIYIGERLLRLLGRRRACRSCCCFARVLHAGGMLGCHSAGPLAGRHRHDVGSGGRPRSCSSSPASASSSTERRTAGRERWASRSPFRSGCSCAIAAFALWSLLDRLLIPSGRWFLRAAAQPR